MTSAIAGNLCGQLMLMLADGQSETIQQNCKGKDAACTRVCMRVTFPMWFGVFSVLNGVEGTLRTTGAALAASAILPFEILAGNFDATESCVKFAVTSVKSTLAGTAFAIRASVKTVRGEPSYPPLDPEVQQRLQALENRAYETTLACLQEVRDTLAATLQSVEASQGASQGGSGATAFVLIGKSGTRAGAEYLQRLEDESLKAHIKALASSQGDSKAQ